MPGEPRAPVLSNGRCGLCHPSPSLRKYRLIPVQPTETLRLSVSPGPAPHRVLSRHHNHWPCIPDWQFFIGCEHDTAAAHGCAPVLVTRDCHAHCESSPARTKNGRGDAASPRRHPCPRPSAQHTPRTRGVAGLGPQPPLSAQCREQAETGAGHAYGRPPWPCPIASPPGCRPGAVPATPRKGAAVVPLAGMLRHLSAHIARKRCSIPVFFSASFSAEAPAPVLTDPSRQRLWDLHR